MRLFARLLWLLPIAALLMTGCDNGNDNNGYNNNNPPTTGTLSGDVIFHGVWPDSGTVQLSIFTNWSTDPCSWCGVAPGGPPAYYTDAQYFQDPDPNNGAGPDTVHYQITGITLGTYDAVAMGWRAPHVSDINCDEPVIGLFGADPYTSDSIPDPVTFTSEQYSLTRNVDAYFDLLPIPGCNDRGRIEGAVRLTGNWPPEGLLTMITTFPVAGAGPAAWFPLMGAPTAYFHMPTAADSNFRFTPPFGIYYLSVWTDAAPPAPVQWYGSYGLNTQPSQSNPVVMDARPDAVTIDSSTPSSEQLVVNAYSPAPHWISGHVTFNGTRPPVGLSVLLSTFMFTPEHPPQGAPTAYFAITDENETLYAVTGIPNGTYYVSLWSNTPPPGQPTFYGAYGYVAGSDTDPDPVDISEQAWGANNIDITGQP